MPAPSLSVLGDAALRYAAHRWSVFPCWWPEAGGCACSQGKLCTRAGKHPLARLAPNGLLDATCDAAVIRGWWTQYPKANIGIRCGEESGLVVLDVDAYKTGLASLEELEVRHGRLPYSIRAKTGSGGGSIHVYLKHPGGIRLSSNSSGKLGPGLDVKADGGYVIAPPSVHASGGAYQWVDVDDSTIEPAPAWLVSLLGRSEQPSAPIDTGVELPPDQARAVVDRLFARAAARVSAGSARHDTAVWLWVQCKDNAIPASVAAEYVDPFLDLAREQGAQRQVSEIEVRKALAWAYGKPRRDPLPSVREALEASLDPEGARVGSAAAGQPPPADFPWIDLLSLRSELRTIEETRCPTGIPSLDDALKGGLPGGVVVGIVGPPGSCKSVLGVQLGLDRARKNGGRLYVYSPDQGGTQPLTRLAGRFGDIVGDEVAFGRFVSELGGLIRVADEREPGVTMESFAAAVLEGKDAAAVLIDTPQTVVTAADDEGERARIDSAMETARLLASRLLIPVIVPNHANRASTAARRKEDRNLPRAAALGSAKVEHRSQVMAFMERVDREDGQTEVEVTLPKVSFGSAGKVFRLLLDPAEWRMREIDKGAREEAEQDAAETARRKALIEYTDKIRKVLKTNPDGLSGKALEERCGGKAVLHRAARLEMADAGELITEERSGRGGGLVWKLPVRRSE